MATTTTERVITDNLNKWRDDDGTLISYAWPGGYQVIYVTEAGETVCPDCAMKDDTSDPAIAGDIFWEGPAITCDDCGKEIESAYGDPDDDA